MEAAKKKTPPCPANIRDISDGDFYGVCLDTFSIDGSLAGCRDTIRNGRCPKKLVSPFS
jgi:hypothetical protein